MLQMGKQTQKGKVTGTGQPQRLRTLTQPLILFFLRLIHTLSTLCLCMTAVFNKSFPFQTSLGWQMAVAFSPQRGEYGNDFS